MRWILGAEWSEGGGEKYDPERSTSLWSAYPYQGRSYSLVGGEADLCATWGSICILLMARDELCESLAERRREWVSL